MVHVAIEAANNLARQGIDCEVLDLRTTSPLDEGAADRGVALVVQRVVRQVAARI